MSDFPKDVTVDVEKEDISDGKPGNICHCAVARALSRALNGLKVRFSGHEAHVWTSDHPSDMHIARYSFPDNVCVFVANFDNRRKVEPFSFVASRI